MPTHKYSTLLTSEENDLIFSLLGVKCCSLATTVVERYVAGGRTGHEDWVYTDMGVICLVKDNLRRSYFFRIFCPIKRQLLWEHELYNFMDYFKLTPYLHTFEAEECIVGFNFASEEEGDVLLDIVKEKLENKKQRRLEKRSRSSTNVLANSRDAVRTKVVGSEVTGAPAIVTQSPPAVPSPPVTSPAVPKARSQQPPTSGSGRGKHKGKLSKDMIGQPQDFRHISHVGWDPDSGFNLDKINNSHLEQFFRKAGVSESQLRDPDTRGFIYQFIEEHGGMEAVKTDLAPPVPARGTKQQHAALSTINLNTGASSHPHPPPPPPPTRTLPPRAPPPPAASLVPPPPPPPPAPPPPSVLPPPPPPPSLAAPPPPMSAPPPTDHTQRTHDSRSDLMQAIRSGTSLKPVSASTTSAGKAAGTVQSSGDGGRGDLLEQIRHGVKLHSVPKSDDTGNKGKSAGVEGGLATALADALAKRALVIQSDTSSSSSSDIDEWDDD